MSIRTILQNYSEQIQTFQLLLLLISALVHVIFAGAVAKDAGLLNQLGKRTALVSANIWAFATLLGGVMVAAVYWFIHHSTITNVTNMNAKGVSNGR